jgi:hypothetical protein
MSLSAQKVYNQELAWNLIVGRMARHSMNGMLMRWVFLFAHTHSTKGKVVYRCGSVLFVQGKAGGKRKIS